MDGPSIWWALAALLIGWYVVTRQTPQDVQSVSDSAAKSPAGSSGLQAFAEAIAFAEGFGVPGAPPTVNHNPGDIKDPSTGLFKVFATDADGWAELYRELGLILPGSAVQYGYTPTMSIQDFAGRWTATQQGDWANNVAYYLGTNPGAFPGTTIYDSIGPILSA